MGLVFYYNDMLEKVTMQRTQQFSGFVCYRKTQLNAMHAQLLEKISRNVPISNDPVVKVSRNLAKNRLETT